MYKKYDIDSDSIFTPSDYADIAKIIEDLNTETKDMSGDHKAEIIISFLKDHKIKSTWVAANPGLVSFLRSAKHLSTLEILFESCKSYSSFSAGLESYLYGRIAP